MKKVFAGMAAVIFLSTLGFSQKFVLKIGAGISVASGSDFAQGIEGQMSYLSDQYAVGGRYSFPHTGMDFAGELIYSFKERMGVGLGLGFIRQAEDDTVSYALGDVSVNERLNPSFNTIPIALNFHYLLPVSSRLSLDLSAGGTYYLTRVNWNYRMDLSLLGLSGTDAYTMKSTAGGFGVQAGLGLQWALSSRIAVCLDIVGRVAPSSFSGKIKGDWTEKGSGDFLDLTDSGSGQYAWAYDWNAGGRSYSQIAFQNETPSGTTISNARYAKFSLSGFAATLGLKIGIGR
jgi:hypothetical protein